ncbi:Per1-like protein [Hyaloraphidium curvatum]|nr:Per1-like protein [Hyaloraphidium curvatum]
MRGLAWGLLAAVLLAAPVAASWGDQEPVYTECVAGCRADDACGTPGEVRPPLHRRLLRWTCDEECGYRCMHKVTAQKVATGEPVEQYFGKWPFSRLLGLQEPASIAFSVLNGWGHVRGHRTVVRNVPRAYSMRRLYDVYALVNANAWFWSAVFHARDFRLTERLDYFAAASIILYAAYIAAVRVFRLYEPRRRAAWAAWTGACAIAYAAHVGYLASLERFDYTYNVVACAVVGAASNVLWVGWWWANRDRPYAWKIAAMAAGISLATMLELFDFPPLWGVFDAHSLWHASTIPLVSGFYAFVRDDAAWEVKMMKRDLG